MAVGFLFRVVKCSVPLQVLGIQHFLVPYQHIVGTELYVYTNEFNYQSQLRRKIEGSST